MIQLGIKQPLLISISMNRFFISIFSIAILFSCNSSKEVVVAAPQSPEAPIKTNTTSGSGYWQQHVDYQMDIDMDVNNYQYKGKQKLVYTNNSPDVLNKVFYHLYFNAFQPGSEMDVRSRTIADPDPRVGDRISKLKPNEIGYIKVNTLKQNGMALNYNTVGTVLEVDLATPIQPGESVTFNMDFDAQVPIQIRRSGRNNKEGVALSMTQWYPKLAEYDFEGWHADPYIGREFHSVWGDFDLKLTIDKNYVVGGTGYLESEQVNGSKKTLHFKLDMNGVENPVNVGIKGDTYPLSWDKTLLLTDNNNDGVFEISIELESASYDIEFKFVNQQNNFELRDSDNRSIRFDYKPETILYETVFNNPEAETSILK